MKKKYIYALGFFDGVHKGHQVLLAHSVRLAQETGLSSGAVTFDSHPQRLTRGNAPEGEFLMLAKVEDGVMSTIKSFFEV